MTLIISDRTRDAIEKWQEHGTSRLMGTDTRIVNGRAVTIMNAVRDIRDEPISTAAEELLRAVLADVVGGYTRT